MTSSSSNSDSVNTIPDQLDPESAQCGNCKHVVFKYVQRANEREKQMCEHRSCFVTRFGSCIDFKRRIRK